MAAPTFVTATDSGWNTTSSPKNAAVAAAAGDILAVLAGSEDSATNLSISGGGLTYTLKGSITSSGHAEAYGWSATATGAVTTAVANSGGGTRWFGQDTLVWRDSDGVGNAATSSTTQSVSLTTTQANSAIMVVITDWSAGSWGTSSRPWLAVNGQAATEVTYFRDSVRYTAGVAYWPDAGAAGAKTVGLSGLSGTWSVVAFEVKGTTGGGSTTYDVSGTVASTSSASGDVSRLARVLAVAGTVAALSATSGDVTRVPVVQSVSGTVAASSSSSGDVTRLGQTLAVSGTVTALSGSSGDVTRPTRTLSVSGAAAALSSASGDVSRVGATPTVSGTVVVASGAQGAVSSLLQVGGTVAAASGSSGDVARIPRTLSVSGTAAAVSATSLGVSVVGGAQTYPVAGTVAATSSTSGALLRIRASVAGTVAATSTSSGNVDVLRAPVTWQVAGTIAATSGSNGSVVLIAQASGTVEVVSGSSGAVNAVSPEDATANPAARLTLDPTPSLSLTATPTLTLTMTRPEVTLDTSTATVADTAPLTGKAGTDLTGADVEAHVKFKDGTVATLTTTVTDAATGAWSATWPEGGVPDVPGVASVELAVTYSDATDQTLGPVVFSIRQQYA